MTEQNSTQSVDGNEDEDFETQYWHGQIKDLIGGTVVGLAIDDSGKEEEFGMGETLYGIKIRTGKKGSKTERRFCIWILRDEEGTGAGAIDVQGIKWTREEDA